MAADLHIHVLTDATSEEELELFKQPLHSGNSKQWEEAYEHIAQTPDIWIGEVSWLKAALTSDRETFIPDTVGKIQDIIGRGTKSLTEEMLQDILNAFEAKNITSYEVAGRDEVEAFLRPYIGQKVFTVSW